MSSVEGHTPASRILMIVPQPFFALRGSPMRVKCTVEILLELGFEVDLLVLPFGDDVHLVGLETHRTLRLPWIDGVPIGPSWSKFLYGMLLSLSATKLFLMRRKHYVAIHGVEEGGVVAAALGCLAKRPYVFDMHSHMSQQLRDKNFPKVLSNFVGKLEDFAIRRSGAVVTVADRLTAYAQSIAPSVPAASIHDIPLDSATSVDPRVVESYRQQYAPSAAKVFVYTGNFESYQGVELLLESFAELSSRSSLPNCVLLLVGGGTAGHDAQRARLEAFCQTRGIAETVVFVGQQPVEEMGNFMALADVLVSPRLSGANTPLKVYSYMKAERPVVATRIASHTQVLEEQSCYLCDTTKESLAQALLQSIDDSPAALRERAAKVAAAKLCIESQFSRAHFKSKLQDLYVPFVRTAIASPEPEKEVLTGNA